MNNLNQIRIAFNNPHAKIPTRGSLLAAGFDLYNCEAFNIKPGERLVVNTGIVFEIPKGYYGKIAPRSGLAVKYGIDIMAGYVDSDFRGSIGVVLINLGNVEISFNQGDRVAQIVFMKHESPELVLCSELSETIRGEGSFGSTGK